MSDPAPAEKSLSRHLRTEAIVVIVAAILAAALAGAYYLLQVEAEGPQQPIPFSHRFHVTTKGLNCFLCHPGGIDSARSGVPPVETCMLCHSHIIIDHPEIVRLREHFEQDRPVEWVRVNDMPDYVYFDHSAHLNRGVDCGQCHGNVAQMDRVAQVRTFEMGFCVQCHRDYGVRHDCLTCHR